MYVKICFMLSSPAVGISRRHDGRKMPSSSPCVESDESKMSVADACHESISAIVVMNAWQLKSTLRLIYFLVFNGQDAPHRANDNMRQSKISLPTRLIYRRGQTIWRRIFILSLAISYAKGVIKSRRWYLSDALWAVRARLDTSKSERHRNIYVLISNDVFYFRDETFGIRAVLPLLFILEWKPDGRK